jgi:hypothetical protein
MSVGWQALLVGLLAGLVGLAELVSRYKSDPTYALRRSAAAWLYIILNAVAGVAALFLIRAFGWTFGQSDHITLWRILVASFSAIAFFRSSLFVTKIGDTSVGVGPSLILGALLDAFDRDVDRKSAENMSGVMKSANLAGLDSDRVTYALPVLCLALMQNFPPGDQAQLGAELATIRQDKTLSPETKMRVVIVNLAKNLGAPVVEKVLTTAREVFLPPAPPPVAAPPAEVVIEKAKQLVEQQDTKTQDAETN